VKTRISAVATDAPQLDIIPPVLSVSVDGREAGISIRDEYNMLLGVLAACKISDAQPTSRPTPARRRPPVAEMDIMVMGHGDDEHTQEKEFWRELAASVLAGAYHLLTIPTSSYVENRRESKDTLLDTVV
jgi:hypothetical protein